MAKKKFKYVPCYNCDSCVLEGPESCAFPLEVEVSPSPSKKSKSDDAAWRREIAMEAGMCMGVDAYNDSMGW